MYDSSQDFAKEQHSETLVQKKSKMMIKRVLSVPKFFQKIVRGASMTTLPTVNA